MSYLYLELRENSEKQQQYRDLLQKHAAGIRLSAEFLVRALQLMQAGLPEDKKHFHGVVFLLGRHAAEEIDAVSVLLAEGCVSPCKSHLRSALEADLGATYILQSDSERRGLAYQVKHTRDRIRQYDKTDPNSAAGKELQLNTATDHLATAVLGALPSIDFDGLKHRLNTVLQKPPFKEINDEWERIKKATKRQPSWHSLFNGPKTIRDLAYHLERGFWYEYLYSDWSEHSHAGGGMNNVGANNDDPTGQTKSFRPLRPPDGLKNVYNFAQTIAVGMGNTIAQRYLSQIGRDDLKRHYLREIRPISEEVGNVEIKADWR